VDELIYALLVWLEDSALGEGLRGSGVWTYAWLNLAHIFGIGTLLGAVLVLDLRLLGVWRSIPVAVLARPTVPLAAVGFAAAVISGATMITVNAVGYAGNPFLYAKLPLIGLAVVNVLVTQRLTAWRRARAGEPSLQNDARQLAAVGGLSLVLWLAVIVCGRMIGYW
jgi:hypothetical protein